MRPKNMSTRPRASCVEIRSTGSWKLATLSETECRSAADPGLGAKGSWTWTTSKGTAPRSCSSERLQIHQDRRRAPRGPLGSGMRPPTASTRGPSPPNRFSGFLTASRMACRDSRISLRVRRRCDNDPMPTLRERLGGPRHEAVYLVP